MPRGAYTREFIARLKALGMNVAPVNSKIATARRGTLAAVVIDLGIGKRIAVNQPKLIVFNAAE
jgi:hypothetical protein